MTRRTKSSSLTRRSPRKQRARRFLLLFCMSIYSCSLGSRPVKIKTELGAPVRPELAMRPRERTALIRETIESTLTKQKEQDHHWEDQVDVSLFFMLFISVVIHHRCLESISTTIGVLLLPALQVCCTCYFLDLGVEWGCYYTTSRRSVASWPWGADACGQERCCVSSGNSHQTFSIV